MSFIITLISMAIIFGILYWFQNRGRSDKKVIVAEHDYFTRLWLWPKGEHTRWEAEYDTKSIFADNGSVGLHAEDNYKVALDSEPAKEEIAFCRKYLSDLSLIFPIAREGIRLGWKEWFDEDLPVNWENEFKINGFSVPVKGDFKSYWKITLYCQKAGHYFNIGVEEGKTKLESIDG